MAMPQVGRIIFFLLIFFLLSKGSVYAQEIRTDSVQNKSVAIADSLFEANLFNKALSVYNQLVAEYPKDPIFLYKLGICQLKSTRDIKAAIDNLKLVSTQEVPNSIYFYLAEAYLHNYQFDEAISFYRRFMLNGGAPQITRQHVEQQVNKCENGNFMLKYIYQPNVIAREKVRVSEFYKYINTKSALGAFVAKPKDLMTSTDKSQNDSSYIFYPLNPEIGNKIFFSSYGANISNGKEIFMIERTADGFWSKPQNLGNTINTSYDEDYPYLASDSSTLYFASKGHYSMGGYDIYRSLYNASTKQWSAPENLGFPFSSPYDDYLFVPNEQESLASFVTNRNVDSAEVEVVLVEIDENPVRRTISSLETIHGIALLNPISLVKETPIHEIQTGRNEGVQKPKSASFSAVENDPEYVRVLAKGFAEQIKADSARLKLEALRQKFDYISTADERRQLEAQVMKIENVFLEAQRNADGYFAQASQIEQEYLTGKRKQPEKPTATFANDNPEFLYQAQFASTVFQTDELTRLAQTEKLVHQIDAQRKLILPLKGKLNGIELEHDDPQYTVTYNEYLALIKPFNAILGEYLAVKKQLYRECISVAMVKRSGSDQPEVRVEMERANLHFRTATTIRNNAVEDAKIESEYEALLLDELGVLRLELAFAKLWGMKLFEQEALSKIYRSEQNIFGKLLVVTESEKGKPIEKPIEKELENQPVITRTEEKIDTKPILFRPEEQPSFQVLEKSLYDAKNPIPLHLPLPQGVIYKIQLAAFSNPIKIDLFKGMHPLSYEPVSGGKVTKYYAGMFHSLADAQKALPVVKSKGFKDAFIAAWHNGRSVPLARAESLEKTEVFKPVDPNVDIKIEKVSNLYMVQIGTFKGRLPEEIAQTIRALAPGKDIVRKPDNQGGFIYSISSFASSNEADRVKDNLVASGLNNAMVIAVELEN